MSRRSRKRKAAGSGGWLVKATVGLLVLGVVGFGGVYWMAQRYLHSDSFRKLLSAEASAVGGVEGEFSSFHWEGMATKTDFYEGVGEGFVTHIKADHLRTEIGLGGISRGVWEISDSSIKRLEISLDSKKRANPSLFRNPQKSPLKKRTDFTWLPKKFDFRGLNIKEIIFKAPLDQGLAVASGMSVRVEPAGASDSYRAEITGGAVKLPFRFLSELQLDRADLRYQDKQVFLKSARIAWNGGIIEAAGEWDTTTQRFSIEGDASDIQCEYLLNPDWAKRLTGNITSNFLLYNHSTELEATGKLTIQNGAITALPMMDVLAAYADTRRFRQFNLTEAHTEWQWGKSKTALTNVVLASDGLVRLEGNIAIQGERLDGTFRLGLAPGILATIPGAETDVFIVGERGLSWTPLRITGTINDPKEDLTDRLIAAAGMRLLEQIPETGEKIIKFTQSVIDSPTLQTAEQGMKIIEDKTRTMIGVTEILDGILSGNMSEEPEQKEP
jgi:hypothetical protein